MRKKGIALHSKSLDSEDCLEVARNHSEYHWIVCSHGDIFTQASPDEQTTANGSVYGNTHYLSVLYVENNDSGFTEAAKFAIGSIIEESELSKVKPHSFFVPTAACPSEEVRTWIREGRPVPEEPLTTAEQAPPPSIIFEDINVEEDDTVDDIVEVEEEEHYCELCERSFKNAAGFSSHARAVHENNEQNEQDESNQEEEVE